MLAHDDIVAMPSTFVRKYVLQRAATKVYARSVSTQDYRCIPSLFNTAI